MNRAAWRGLLFNWAPALAYMALIWWLSSQRLSVPTEYVPARDKGIHFVEFASLGVILARAMLLTWPRIWVRAAVAALITTFAWGVLDELHQAFVPGRSAEFLDLVADGLGAMTGVVLFTAFWRWRVRAAQPRRA